MKALLLFLAIVALVVASQPVGANPTPPKFPDEFSVSAFVQRTDGTASFFRWFYSDVIDKSRIDGMVPYHGQNFFRMQIYDHVSEYAYDVYVQNGAAVCFFHQINGTVPKPDLSVFNYIGQAELNFHQAYLWMYYDRNADLTFTYWDDQISREPLRLDVWDARRSFGETWDFWEVDEGPQEENLFVLPDEIVATCNRE